VTFFLKKLQTQFEYNLQGEKRLFSLTYHVTMSRHYALCVCTQPIKPPVRILQFKCPCFEQKQEVEV
jgi:hypothetical protein